MKKIFLIFSFISSILLLVGCVSTGSENPIISKYDIVTDSTTIEHKDLQGSIWGYVNVNVGTNYSYDVELIAKVINGIPTLYVTSCGQSRLGSDKVVFISEKLNKRLVFSNLVYKDSTSVTSHAIYYTEHLVAPVLAIDDFNSLIDILKNEPKIAIMGSRKNTDLYKIPPKIANAIIELFTYDSTEPEAPKAFETTDNLNS